MRNVASIQIGQFNRINKTKAVSKNYWTYGFYFCCFLEIVAQYLLPSKFGYASISPLFFISSLGVVVLGLKTHGQINDKDHNPPKMRYLITILSSVFLLVCMLHYLPVLFEASPLDYRKADMLPIMDIMSKRFLNGQGVYAIIPEIWGGMQPIYLPAMWLPFTISEIGAFDMRWVTSGLLFSATIAIIYKSSSQKFSLAMTILFSILIWAILLVSDLNFLMLTEEGIVVFYYVFLGLMLLSKNPYWLGLAMSLCVLSRYALAPWLVMYLAALFFYHHRGFALKTGITLLLSAMVLMTIGQGWSALDVFLSLPDNYLSSILEDPNKYRPVLAQSPGLAKYVAYENLATLHLVFKFVALGIPVLGFIWYARIKDKINIEFYFLCLLKLCLVCFYNLIILPYPYLFYTSTFLTLLLLAVNHKPITLDKNDYAAL